MKRKQTTPRLRVSAVKKISAKDLITAIGETIGAPVQEFAPINYEPFQKASSAVQNLTAANNDGPLFLALPSSILPPL